MAGEFTQGRSHETIAALDKEQAVDAPVDNKFETDVPEVKADAQVKVGTEVYPVFDVDSEAFNQNMMHGRKRIRFKTGTPAAEYMRASRYNRPFYIRNTDARGQKFTRRIK
jgi:hypothetical protein